MTHDQCLGNGLCVDGLLGDQDSLGHSGDKKLRGDPPYPQHA